MIPDHGNIYEPDTSVAKINHKQQLYFLTIFDFEVRFIFRYVIQRFFFHYGQTYTKSALFDSVYEKNG